MKKLMYVTVLIGVLGLLSACGTSRAVLPSDVSNRAMSIQPVEDKALLYIYRSSQLGWAVGMRIDLDQVQQTSLYGRHFYLCALPPGSYHLKAYAENRDTMTVNVEAGKRYYVEVTPRMGIFLARCKLHAVDEDEGREKVKKCNLVGLNEEAQKMLNYTPPPVEERKGKK